MHFWFQMTRACITWKTRGLDSRTCQIRPRFITRRSTYVIAARCTVKRVRSIDIYGTNAERRQTCRARNAGKCLNTGIMWRSIWRVAASKTWETLIFSRCSTSISLPVENMGISYFCNLFNENILVTISRNKSENMDFSHSIRFSTILRVTFIQKNFTTRIDNILLVHPFFIFLHVLKFTLDIIFEIN